MRALSYERWQAPVAVVDLADPAPPDDGVVVRVGASGLCRSDWHAWMGHDPTVALPHVPGHEFAGKVVAVGSAVHHWRVGARVTAPFVLACGRCRQCRRGHQQVCEDQWQPGFDGWGSHAELVAVPRADVNLVAVPDELDDASAAGLGCRFTTAFRAVVDQGRASAGEWVAVHGCGGVGLSSVMIASAVGARVVAVDVDDARLDQARDLGAEAAVEAGAVADVAAAVREVTGGGAAVSIDALGSPVTCAGAVGGLAIRGRHVQVGLLPAGAHVPMDLVVARELELLGSHGMPATRFVDVLELVRIGRLQPHRLVGQRLSLAEGAAALAAAAEFTTTGLSVIEPALHG